MADSAAPHAYADVVWNARTAHLRRAGFRRYHWQPIPDSPANFCLMVVVFQFGLAVLLTAGIPQPWTTHAVVISPNNLRIGRQPYSAAGLYFGCDRGLSASTLCQSMRHIGCNNSSRLSNGSLT